MQSCRRPPMLVSNADELFIWDQHLLTVRPLLVPQLSAPSQEATLLAVKTEANTSNMPQPSASSVTPHMPAKPAGNSQALNGTSSLPPSKLPAVRNALVYISVSR